MKCMNCKNEYEPKTNLQRLRARCDECQKKHEKEVTEFLNEQYAEADL